MSSATPSSVFADSWSYCLSALSAAFSSRHVARLWALRSPCFVAFTWQRLTTPEYHNVLHLLWRGWEEHNIDMTKIMYAVRTAVDNRLDRKTDARAIAARFGLRGEYFQECFESLVARGFLERRPKRGKPYLVRLTHKSLTAFAKN